MADEDLEIRSDRQWDIESQRTVTGITSHPDEPSEPLKKSKLSRILSRSSQKQTTDKERLQTAAIPEMNLTRGIVGWERQDDPDMPLNFPARRKWLLMSLIAWITFMSPFASSIFSSGVPEMNIEFHNADSLLASLTVSIMVLGFAVGPLFLSPLSEMYGRRRVLSGANIFLCLWQLACALAPNINSLIAFRFLAGVGGSGCLSIGGGVISDLFHTDERGVASALFALGPLLGPVLGPICGGFIATEVGWRWIFWVLLIASGIVTVAIEVFNQETKHDILIQRKLKRLSKELGRNDLISCYYNETTPKTPRAIMLQGLTRPLKLLTRSPIVFLLSLYVSVVYGLLYLFFTTLGTVFTDDYHWSSDLVGLVYIGMGLGFISGILLVAKMSDATVVRMTRANGGISEPEMRLPACVFFGCFIPITFFWYGWAADQRVHWIVPIIGLFPFGFGMMGIFIPIQTYLIDSFPNNAASAVAATISMRSVFGAFLPLAGPSLFQTLGLGWGNSLLGFVAVALIPVPALMYKLGSKIRKEYPVEL